MTAAPQSPMVERATDAVIERERTKYPMQRFVARRFTQAALEACHAEELVEALREAVEANRLRPPCYRTVMPKAEALVAKLDGQTEEESSKTQGREPESEVK